MLRALCLSTLLFLSTLQQGVAGNIAPAPDEPVVIVEDTSSSAGGIIVPLLALILIAAVAASGSSGGGSDVVAGSDARLKRDILRTGETASGLPLYTWRYVGGTARWEGVMAQDVARLRPEAIIDGPFGYMLVDYGMLGLEMRRAD